MDNKKSCAAIAIYFNNLLLGPELQIDREGAFFLATGKMYKRYTFLKTTPSPGTRFGHLNTQSIT